MALFPNLATVALLPQAASSPAMTPRLLVAHTTGGPGSPEQIRSYFSRPGNGVFSHFVIGWDGYAVQMQDTARQAPAQWDANPFAVSFETQDDGDNSRPWTAPQLAKLVALMKAVAAEHRIPTTAATAWNGSGVTYHQQFAELNHNAHNCPGPVRVAQLRSAVLPALAPVPPSSDWFDMATPADLENALRNVLKLPATGLAVPVGQAHNGNLGAALLGTEQAVYNQLKALDGQVTALRAEVAALKAAP